MTAASDNSSEKADPRIAEASRLLTVAGEPEAAAKLYAEAAEAGSGAAAERLAVLAAIGVARSADWKERSTTWPGRRSWGTGPAQRQLAILGNREDLGGRTLRPAMRLTDTDLVTVLVQERLARSGRLPVHTHEPPNLLHYLPGQEYRPHYDFINPQVPAFREQLAVLGQRIATCLIYLNDDYTGGETAFLRLGWQYRGRPGDALLFFNVDGRGQPHPQSLHAGLPPTRGEKWVLSMWVRDRVQPIL